MKRGVGKGIEEPTNNWNREKGVGRGIEELTNNFWREMREIRPFTIGRIL